MPYARQFLEPLLMTSADQAKLFVEANGIEALVRLLPPFCTLSFYSFSIPLSCEKTSPVAFTLAGAAVHARDSEPLLRLFAHHTRALDALSRRLIAPRSRGPARDNELSRATGTRKTQRNCIVLLVMHIVSPPPSVPSAFLSLLVHSVMLFTFLRLCLRFRHLIRAAGRTGEARQLEERRVDCRCA